MLLPYFGMQFSEYVYEYARKMYFFEKCKKSNHQNAEKGLKMHVSEILGTTFICADCRNTVTIEKDGCSFNYATKRSGEKVCDSCVRKEEIRHIENDEKVFCYLSSNGQNLTDWKGNILAKVTANWDIKNNFAGTITCIRAITNNCRKLYGKSSGKGMCMMLRPCK